MNKIFLGDCFEIMSKIEDSSVDMILADLPYGITSNKWDNILPIDDYLILDGKKLNKEEYLLHIYKTSSLNYIEANLYFEKNKISGLLSHYLRILKQNGVIALTASQPFSSILVSKLRELYRHEWIWIKNRGSNFANTVREPFKEHEQVLIFSRGKWTYNKQMQERTGSGLNRVKYNFNKITESDNYRKFDRASDSKGKNLRVPSSHQKFNTEVGLHPTQKPVDLFRYLIRTYTNEGDIVLDNTSGSGTTGIACIMENRNYILIEKDEKYFNISNERIEKLKIEFGIK